jgi:hypothetical protein
MECVTETQGWLNDEVLKMGVLEVLSSKRSQHVVALESNFYESLLLESGSLNFAKHTSILESPVTIIPVNHENNHWILFVIFNINSDDANIFGIDNANIVESTDMKQYAMTLLKYAYYYLYFLKFTSLFNLILRFVSNVHNNSRGVDKKFELGDKPGNVKFTILSEKVNIILYK